MSKFLVISLFVMLLAGCATPGVKQTQVQELQNRIATLERELQTKNEQIRSLEEGLYPKESKKKEGEKGILGITPKRIQ